jgi:hypothetical protein
VLDRDLHQRAVGLQMKCMRPIAVQLPRALFTRYQRPGVSPEYSFANSGLTCASTTAIDRSPILGVSGAYAANDAGRHGQDTAKGTIRRGQGTAPAQRPSLASWVGTVTYTRSIQTAALRRPSAGRRAPSSSRVLLFLSFAPAGGYRGLVDPALT